MLTNGSTDINYVGLQVLAAVTNSVCRLLGMVFFFFV
jgi:hypothetical protein